ncbi:putative Fe-S cluster-containing MiaB family protein [Paenibacillus endophyticus]|uniref:Putative Fe-S cluster-containing MiaB family protein n=1 Tax=Paenibacillus endophyticus TaxID=1294268 RepID=A0A7W5C9C7_9BACL|nr:hypothetical protein [Paenibacillus endophyticus]MBB3153074.1 putative Fe-S cluster-containing MiaB family protein [Paenibacillus endophyticus]
MNMKSDAEHIRKTIDKLFKDAGYTVPELLIYIETLEKNHEQLALQMNKMKLDSVRKASAAAGMNSRLKDALRE